MAVITYTYSFTAGQSTSPDTKSKGFITADGDGILDPAYNEFGTPPVDVTLYGTELAGIGIKLIGSVFVANVFFLTPYDVGFNATWVTAYRVYTTIGDTLVLNSDDDSLTIVVGPADESVALESSIDGVWTELVTGTDYYLEIDIQEPAATPTTPYSNMKRKRH